MDADLDLRDGLFHVLFVTTPARLRTPRFGAYFDKADLSALHVAPVLKRREPHRVATPAGQWATGWGPACAEEEFDAAARELWERARSPWINVEGDLRELDLRLTRDCPGLGALVSGHELAPEAAARIARALPKGTPTMLALENEAMLLAAPTLLGELDLAGLVIGTSYLSESSKMYDQMGLERYRSLMRGVAKRAAALGRRPYTTSNYCTFEATGAGDRNKAFVAEQVKFVSKAGDWGSITRFYSHLDVAQTARALVEGAARRRGGHSWQK